MSEVRIVGVALDSVKQPVVLLKPTDQEPGTGKILPIWIGPLEATSIIAAVQGAVTPRPFAHDLMRSMLESLNAEVDRVEVSSLTEGTFFAVIYLDSTSGEHSIDARPSDAIALAARTGAAIHVADEVLEEAGIADTLTDGLDDHEENDEERLEEFRKFLDTVDPEDFKE